jgi:solute carrier family 13 (sodium-dependent dicarboxylate transporter), member 2/3/5
MTETGETSPPREGLPVAGNGFASALGLIAGPVLAVIVSLLPAPAGLDQSAMQVAGLFLLMAIWWATEAVPMAVTSLLPLAILPLTGLMPLKDIAAPYADPVVMLLLGGFIVALAIEKWNLHRRIALNVLRISGARLKLLTAGVMLSTALLSMWISNTATSLMMAPIVLSVALAAGGGPRLAIALLLGVCYAASIGGLGTPVGTPTNLIAMGWLRDNAGIEIGFSEWMGIGVPMIALMLPAAWLILTLGLKSTPEQAQAASESIRTQHKALGRVTRPEARVAIVFGLIAGAWILREQLVKFAPLAGLSDMGIAMMGAVLMFLVPHGDGAAKAAGRGRGLLDWDDARNVPWDVVLLFGGGLSIAAAIQASGLAGWLGGYMAGLATLPPVLLILIIVTLVVFLSEIMSNVAAMTTFLPVLGALAEATGLDIRALVIPCCVAASCGFMLPIATGPNAVVFATRKLTVRDMAKAGFALNVTCIVIIALYFGL